MAKYELVVWPESQKWMGHPDCISHPTKHSIFVPLDLVEENYKSTMIYKAAMFQTVAGCPTVFTGTADNGDEIEFRLRHGAWSVEINGRLAGNGPAPSGCDGVCDWAEARDMMFKENIIVYNTNA